MPAANAFYPSPLPHILKEAISLPHTHAHAQVFPQVHFHALKLKAFAEKVRDEDKREDLRILARSYIASLTQVRLALVGWLLD